MLLFGVAYRVLAARLAAPVTARIDPAALEQFPFQVGDWTGEDVILEEAIIRQTDTDARINRRYRRPQGADVVSFYVAAGVRARDLSPHRPEVCYTGAGWTLVGRQSLDLPLPEGTTLPCNVLQFARGALQGQKIVVLDYYLVDGQYCRDVSLLRSKAWRGAGAVRYVAQVQIMTAVPDAPAATSSTRLVSTFATESAAWVARLFETSQDKDPRPAPG